MAAHAKSFSISTKGYNDTHDLTNPASQFVAPGSYADTITATATF